MRVKQWIVTKLKLLRGSDGTVIDPAERADVQAVDASVTALRGQLPSSLTGSGNLPVAVQERPEFERISAKAWKDTEEVRFDIPADLASATIYTGVAPDNTPTATAVWTVVRTDFDASGNPSRQRIRFSVAWDARATGW